MLFPKTKNYSPPSPSSPIREFFVECYLFFGIFVNLTMSWFFCWFPTSGEIYFVPSFQPYF
jgi:hypothetical protein